MPDLSVLAWVVLGLGALGVGFSKTAIGGVASISVAMYATVLPARASTGTLLLLLLCGDVVAIIAYRQDVAWRDLVRLIPPVVVGVLVGALFLGRVNDHVLRVTMGVVLLLLVGVHFAREGLARRRQRKRIRGDGDARPAEPMRGRASPTVQGIDTIPGDGDTRPPQTGRERTSRLIRTIGYGTLAGFTTMVANSGGVAMTLYLLTARFPMMRFLGTGAWFFFAVNTFKIPFSLGLGLITRDSLIILGLLGPLVLLGTWLGRRLIDRIDQPKFNTAALAFIAVSAVFLLV